MAEADIQSRLAILVDAAKYDASCASSGSTKRDSQNVKSCSARSRTVRCTFHIMLTACAKPFSKFKVIVPLPAADMVRMRLDVGVRDTIFA